MTKSHTTPGRTLIVMMLAALSTAAVSCQSKSRTGDVSKPQADGGASAPESKPMSIEDVTWRLAEVGGRPAEPAPADARAAHLRLNAANKRVNGYSGVNAFSGGYELAGASLRFAPLAMTRRAGPEPLNRQESAFTRALTDTRSWRAAGDRLELLDAGGKPLAALTRVAVPTNGG